MIPRVAKPAASTAGWNVFVDFDGMVVPGDATDGLFARFANPSWRAVEERWQRGEITGIECMGRQVAMLRATPGEIGRYLESVSIDPHFRSFVRLCRSKGAAITVVSDGMDLIVGTVLRHAGLDIGFHANELCWQGEDRWTLKFPFAREDCAARIGNCKCSHRRAAGGSPSIMVGDGRSDFCIARECDFVLAKGALAAHCARLALPFAEICDFADARRLLAAWLRRRSSPTVSARVSRSDATAALKSAS